MLQLAGLYPYHLGQNGNLFFLNLSYLQPALATCQIIPDQKRRHYSPSLQQIETEEGKYLSALWRQGRPD